MNVIFDITFLMVAMTLTFQVLGLGKMKIFLIFAVGGYVGLMTYFTDSVAFMIVLVGLMVFNLWYLFYTWGKQ